MTLGTRSRLSLSDKKFDEIVNVITTTFPKSCVLWIEKIVSDELYARYSSEKETILALYGEAASEVSVFHGTHENNIDSIIANGFQISKNKRSAFGKGTYFAKAASISSQYMVSENEIAYMFLCKVCIGKVVQYPVTAKATGECNVDNLENPTIYVVKDNDAIYPEYIIAFHKSAK